MEQLRIVCDYIPEYKTSGAACFDLRAVEEHNFEPFEFFVMGTGFRCEVPKGYCLLVFSRFSLGARGLIIPESVRVIDSDYRNEVKVPLMLLNNYSILIEKGEFIARAMLVKTEQCEMIRVAELSGTERGDGGFGSTGKN